MKEYKLITGNDKDNQTKLNQWRHTYIIEILAMCSRNDQTTILLTREKI